MACENVPQEDIDKAKFGLGTFQWTDHGREVELLECYKEVCGDNNYPTFEQCCHAEVLAILRELDGTYGSGYYKRVVTDKLENINGVKEACILFCKNYEGQTSVDEQNKRAKTAEIIYRILVEE